MNGSQPSRQNGRCGMRAGKRARPAAFSIKSPPKSFCKVILTGLMPESRRLKLVISYDGRDFAGWQSQKQRNTIQDNLEAAFEHVCGQRLTVTGSGRTDSGVHALGQCAHVDVPAAQFVADRWLKALNGVLPQTIRILRAHFVLKSFHARFSAKGKVYRYRIINGL